MRQSPDIEVEDVGRDGLLITLPGAVKSEDHRERAETVTGREYVQVSSLHNLHKIVTDTLFERSRHQR